MMKIKQYGEKWRLEVENEEWEFRSRKDMESRLKILLDLKESKGQLKVSK
jgi:hypothetical protein